MLIYSDILFCSSRQIRVLSVLLITTQWLYLKSGTRNCIMELSCDEKCTRSRAQLAEFFLRKVSPMYRVV